MKNKILSFVLGLAGAILVVASLYFAISYFSYIGKAIIDFLAANNVENLTSCGIVIPSAFMDIRDMFPATILPMLYLGIPLLLVAISALMFGSGYFYGKHSIENEAETHRKREEHIQSEVDRRIAMKSPAAQPPKPQEKPAYKPPAPQKK